MSTNNNMLSVAQFCKEANVSYDLARTLLNKIKPSMTMPYGRGTASFYSRDDVMPLIARQREKAQLANKQPSLPVSSTGTDTLVKALGLQMQTQYDQLRTDTALMLEKLTAQNRSMHSIMDKQCKQIAVLLMQLGVKDVV